MPQVQPQGTQASCSHHICMCAVQGHAVSSCGLVSWGLRLPLVGPWGSSSGRWGGSFLSEPSHLNCAHADTHPEIRVSVLGERTADSVSAAHLPLGSPLLLPLPILWPPETSAYTSPALMCSLYLKAPS